MQDEPLDVLDERLVTQCFDHVAGLIPPPGSQECGELTLATLEDGVHVAVLSCVRVVTPALAVSNNQSPTDDQETGEDKDERLGMSGVGSAAGVPLLGDLRGGAGGRGVRQIADRRRAGAGRDGDRGLASRCRPLTCR